ncbi:N-formylglutamate deformylase [Kushneria aurantia]|uniref:N-formylglutamate deformylase n=1 Tax=Kushneria aurantia TaxID=504092 RepID=A0ABV6G6H9_9GAMM|nr:N-formylglutamate deformylase [Kushneria aurantia]
MTSFELTRGDTPLLISIPHAGVRLTPEVEAGLTDQAHALTDTDWYMPELYDFTERLGCSRLRGLYSRYVIDLNRPADDTPLYAGATTGLFPEIDFDGRPLFRPGLEPAPQARTQALAEIWQPYHQALAAELQRLKARFGYALLFDAHSIRSQVPRLFEGPLPDINLGTFEGASCAPALSERLQALCAAQSTYSWVLNGRFKGGYMTRHYGNPADNVHAVQLELSQHTYMAEPEAGVDYPGDAIFPWREERAARVRPLLEALMSDMQGWVPQGR